jgi:hypothetical protein
VVVRRSARRPVVGCAALGLAAGAYAVGSGHSAAPASSQLGASGMLLAAAKGAGESLAIHGVDITITYSGPGGTTVVAHANGTQRGSAAEQARLRQAEAAAKQAAGH